MEYLARVHDGSERTIGNGYWMCEVVGAESGGNEVAPNQPLTPSSLCLIP